MMLSSSTASTRPGDEIGVRMHVVVVRDGNHAEAVARVEQNLIGRRGAERGDALAAQIGERR